MVVEAVAPEVEVIRPFDPDGCQDCGHPWHGLECIWPMMARSMGNSRRDCYCRPQWKDPDDDVRE